MMRTSSADKTRSSRKSSEHSTLCKFATIIHHKSYTIRIPYTIFRRFVYGVFGMTYKLELSTRPKKALGEVELWNLVCVFLWCMAYGVWCMTGSIYVSSRIMYRANLM
ncbi:hypothetical protein EON63_12060 [archaeon]|nr:MAG: hypothetical protein EON63_12060 [archaeon]